MTNKTKNHEGITNITNRKNIGNFSVDNFNFEHVDFVDKIMTTHCVWHRFNVLYTLLGTFNLTDKEIEWK